MDIRQLTYFLTILEEGNITKAAEKLHIAQPPLSQQLKLLEDELGVKLIDRSTRKIQITDAGHMLQQRAKQILELVETTIKELNDFNGGLQGTLSIGTVSSGAMLLPERIYQFHGKYPSVNFQIHEGDTTEILELIKSGMIEIGIVRTPLNTEIFESIFLPTEPMIAVTSDKSDWDDSVNFINLTELSKKPILLDRRYERAIIEACLQAGFEPRILCKSNDPKTILLWANTGIGVAIVPKTCLGLIESINLKYKDINEPSLLAGTAVVWLKNKYLPATARHFLETFKL